MRHIIMGLLLAVAGCGQPLYPKTIIKIDPATGRIERSSEQETDLVIGAIDAGTALDGTKYLRVGTTSQPAVTYGEAAVGVMKEYGQQQLNYVLILKQLGDNAVNSINAIGDAGSKILGGLAGLRQFAISTGDVQLQSQCDALIAEAQGLQGKVLATKSFIESLQPAEK